MPADFVCAEDVYTGLTILLYLTYYAICYFYIMNLFAIVTCALLHSQTAYQTKPLKLFTDTSYIDTVKYVIIPFDSSRDKYKLEENSKTAVLYATEIKKIEKIIRKEISSYNELVAQGAKMRAMQKALKQNPLDSKKMDAIKNDPLMQNVINNPGKYYKQFITVINSKGEKEVWVECLCKVSDQSWRKEPIIVEDGGYCYFHIKINLTTGLVSDFGINSNA